MTDNIIENNQAAIIGRIDAEFTFSHRLLGEGFYTTKVIVNRQSESCDCIPVMVSERLVNVLGNYKGKYVEIVGQFRSYNRHEPEHNRLILVVFAREIRFLNKVEKFQQVNDIFLNGYVCKTPVYRKTPMGREITDILLGVNRPYCKSDYIPCICWGRTARYAASLEIGGHVLISGRVQSRNYIKRIENDKAVQRVAYEVSINRLESVG